ncbi:hypothetical protein QYE76_035730 [Lolium multiflorum]|uniref:Retrotransposon gag domain-containing protein n=1 Tax=Lolium multiflorum TaxID=4521 RepID=A0AAD8R1E0_LOLMU|nr:hypothetical protein QYE76_035730 [Lolium multiflorum]
MIGRRDPGPGRAALWCRRPVDPPTPPLRLYKGLHERDIFDLFLPEFDKPWVIHLRETCCCSTNLCSWRPNTVYKNRSSRRHQPATEITTREGDKAVTIPNSAYHHWWTQDQKVLGFLLGAMEPSISCQLIGCKTAAAAWTSVHAMFGAHSRANVRNIRRQLQSLRKEDRSAADYMHMMKSLADSMAAAGSPISDDDLVDYIITGLGSA